MSIRNLRILIREILAEEVSFKTYSDKPEENIEARSAEQLRTDKDFKKEWNRKADHDFFDKELVKIHYVGGFTGNHCSRDSEGACILDKLKKFKLTKNKNEMSVVGYLPPIFPLEKNVLTMLALIIDGKVTYAAAKDTETEYTSQATDKDKKKFASSGLQKRASVSLKPQLKDLAIYNKQDFVQKTSSEEHNELVMDNFRVSGILIDLSNDYFSNEEMVENRIEELKDIGDWCNQNGMGFYDMKTGRDLLKPGNITLGGSIRAEI